MSKRYPGGIIRKTPQTPSQTSAQGVWGMTDVTQAQLSNTWPIAGLNQPVSRSLRFRSSASAYLSRTFGTPTNNTVWTYSCWIKRGNIGTQSGNSSGFFGNSDALSGMYFISSDVFRVMDNSGSVASVTTAVYRDPSAWAHLVVKSDGTYIKTYWNNVEVASYTGTITNINKSGQTYYIGRYSSTYLDGYLAEVNFIDGQALTPSSFGASNPFTGVWQPAPYTGSYGTNGFYLPFSDVSSLGKDFSGNSNNWTTNNISTTAGVTYDSMVDVPTQWMPYNTTGDIGGVVRGNYCTMNPLTSGTQTTLTGANLNLSQPSGSTVGNSRSTFAMTTGKWYMEVTLTASAVSIYPQIGIMTSRDGSRPNNDYPQAGYSTSSLDPTLSVIYMANGQKQTSGTGSSYGNSFTNGDVIGVAIDSDNGAIYFSKNGTFQNSGVPTSGSSKTGAALTWTGGTVEHVLSIAGYSSTAQSVNFGQQPFAYTPPSGFVALNTFNLPTPTIGATASTQANKYMDATTYTGTGSSLAIVNAGGFQPDFVWTKPRSTAVGHTLFDAIRGVTNYLQSNTTGAEGTAATSLTAFNSNGFTVNSDTSTGANGVTYVGWQWKANGSGSSNTSGSITSTVSANTSAGFSIVTFTTTTASTQTWGHGLGVAPKMVIVKWRDSADNWYVYHESLGNNAQIKLNTTDAQTTPTTLWNTTSPSSTVVTFGSGFASAHNFVAYCFAEVAGYSKFGSYTGNGSSDGPFIYTGFRPKFIMFKGSSVASSWVIEDTSRSPYNESTLGLLPNSSTAETTGVGNYDFLSNGFKCRNVQANEANVNGQTYIYMAFAESPFKYALAR